MELQQRWFSNRTSKDYFGKKTFKYLDWRSNFGQYVIKAIAKAELMPNIGGPSGAKVVYLVIKHFYKKKKETTIASTVDISYIYYSIKMVDRTKISMLYSTRWKNKRRKYDTQDFKNKEGLEDNKKTGLMEVKENEEREKQRQEL